MIISLPTYTDVQAAARRLEGIAHRTPVMRSRTLNRLTQASLFFKCENFQRTGSFKFRGAYNAMATLSEAERRRGVLTYSSGNHAQALALAGRLLGVPVTVVMPQNAPEVKRRATASYGAELVFYDPEQTTREALGQQLAAERGLAIIPPYDHPHIIAGQGTAARELLEEVGPLDVLLVPCGGGGLLSGSALSARALAPRCRVVGVEPAQADDATRSFRTGRLHRVHNPDTIADGARTPSLGHLTFPLVRQYVDDMVTVSEKAILQAMYVLWERLKLVIEPTGALPLAALLENRVAVAGQRVGLILSGGNVDLRRAAELFARLDQLPALPPSV
ncbi:threo-3-hydroxy-L-aspartate ammonia-lyase [Rhodothermus profundi]|uniref:L-threonine ammonia-lyase n=1 Tax=Rhodothermus profundi TaxID=633813 RepID=A0A1M6TGV8_9BACT|nr:threo-3-hydroxy-L-aspartate ammonia-lyase [Rhodothermus profundi]SHK56076.1 L-threonine ammonia-lyase [Rhodothermus profundi]